MARQRGGVIVISPEMSAAGTQNARKSERFSGDGGNRTRGMSLPIGDYSLRQPMPPANSATISVFSDTLRLSRGLREH